MNPVKLILVAGARPNFMKIAPVIKAIEKKTTLPHAGIMYKIVHTGQHYDVDMTEVFFKDLDIPHPHVNLDVGSASHAVQTANIMIRFEQVCCAENPDWVVVVGDVNSTMACTLVASKMGIKVAHIEAGLRSFDRSMPEEINRIVTDSLADLLFTPSPDADENLKNEGIPSSKIRYVGNVMIDTLVANLEKARKKQTHKDLGLKEKGFGYVTLHRPCNVDENKSLDAIMNNLNQIASAIPIVFPIHPRTKKMLAKYNIAVSENNHLRLIEPVGYHDSICLAEHSRFVLTDSGGLQEETTFFRTPCLTLRPNTERPITVTEGSNALTSIDSLQADVEAVLNGPLCKGTVPDLWDGHSAERIVTHLL
ncbi:MAG: non-hydrolyzing UDP-N-acetylglucosamine 2-epimerase, partial [Candidatus Thorarchaeota archaeon]